jgi:dTDP-4-amino-4,6-dideoxygalactose transaminase
MSLLALYGGQPALRRPLAGWPVFGAPERDALSRVFESASWGGYSPVVKDFESRFAAEHQCRFGISVANGTLSLEAALTALQIGRNDEVIVPPITFVATATAVLKIGAVPVFADIDAVTYNLDPKCAENAITEKTRAIIPVHFAGHPADMDALQSIAERNKIFLIEDCAHAHGASWCGRKAGSFGQFGSFSFQQSKNMTAGEGGILLTNDEHLAEIAWSLTNQGRSPGGAWYQHDRLGSNLRMTGLQAAILTGQLGRLPAQLSIRARNAAILTARLNDSAVFVPPRVNASVTTHGFHLYLLRIKSQLPQLSRNLVMQALIAEGLPGVSCYPYPIYRNRLFASHVHRITSCPNAEQMSRDCLWLSSEVLLTDPDDLEDVLRAFEKISDSASELVEATAPAP